MGSTLITVEIILLAIIAGFQVYSALRTYFKTDRFKNFFPGTIIFEDEIQEEDEKESEDIERLKLIEVLPDHSKEYKELTEDINVYLKNTEHQAPEYNVIEEITEKKSESADDNVNVTLYSPLYLGLMGTILGIIFGVWGFMSEVDKDTDNKSKDGAYQIENTQDVVQTNIDIANRDLAYEGNNSEFGPIKWILKGVVFAMLASVLGLFLSYVNSAFFYQRARIIHDRTKLKFLNKVRVELIPAYQFKDTSTIPSLNKSIVKFNRDLSRNVKKLSDLTEQNMRSIESQAQVFSKIENMNIENILSKNVQLLELFSVNIQHLEKLNSSLSNVNNFVAESSSLSIEANRLFGRFKHFESNSEQILRDINNKLNVSEELLNFLKSHFEQLNERGDLIRNAVGNVDEAVIESINQLKVNNNQSLEGYRKNVGEIDSTLKSSMEELKQHLNQQLAHLVEQTSKQADFVGTGYETAIKKYNETLITLSDEVSGKISRLHEVAEAETVRLEKSIGENKENLNKLGKLDDIDSHLKKNSDFQEDLVQKFEETNKILAKSAKKRINASSRKNDDGKMSKSKEVVEKTFWEKLLPKKRLFSRKSKA